MKKCLLFFLVLFSSLHAQYYLDTLTSKYVGPGVIYTKIVAPTVPWSIDVLKIDLKNPYIKLESVKGKDRYLGEEVLSSMSKRRSYDGHFAVGGVNADYFVVGTGEMTNIQIGQGELLRGPVKSSVIGFDVNNKPLIDIVTMDAKVFANGTSLKINTVNQNRGTNQLLFCNSFKASTGTDTSGTEALVRPLKEWLANDTISCVVENVVSSVGNMDIPKGKAVLSGNGTASVFIKNNLHLGDTVKIYMGLNTSVKKLKEMVGGRPKLVKGGVNYLEEALKNEAGSSTYTREPRTAAGISKDSTYLYLIVLDGRQTYSVGATLDELADVMVRLGVYDGINLDGGGSSTLVARNEVMNIPSGGGIERAVGNGFLVISSAPTTAGSLSGAALTVHSKRIYKGEKLQFNVAGYDNYYNPVTINPTDVQFSVSSGLGSIDSTGKFTAGAKPAGGYVYMKYNQIKDSAYVFIKSINKLDVTPKSILVDGRKTFTLSYKGFDADAIERSVYPGEIIWKSTNNAVAAVDSNGIVYGKAEGKAKVIAEYKGTVIADTIDVAVQIGKGTMAVSTMDNITGWKLSGLNIDTTATKLSIAADNKTEGSGALKIDYKFKYDPTVANYVYLDTQVPVYGMPDSLFIDTRSDSTNHKLFLIFANTNNEFFRVNAYGYINTPDRFNTIPVPMKNFAALGGGVFYYPATLTRIEIQLQYNNSKRVSGQTYSGTIYMDNLRAKYPSDISAVEDLGKNMPMSYKLMQNYPNPFNPSTVIEFSTAANDNVALRVYDILGREVAVLVNENLSAGLHKAVWNSGNNPSGVYFYRLQCKGYTETRKMLLVR